MSNGPGYSEFPQHDKTIIMTTVTIAEEKQTRQSIHDQRAKKHFGQMTRKKVVRKLGRRKCSISSATQPSVQPKCRVAPRRSSFGDSFVSPAKSLPMRSMSSQRLQRGAYAIESDGECETSTKKSRTSLEFTQRNIDETKRSSEHLRQTEKVFTTDQTDTILGDLRTFVLDGLKITNCIFRRDQVEICYVFDENHAVHNRDELRQQLADHLKIDSKTIKMTKLRAKPVYKETTMRPGETATIQSQGHCKIGAFVKIEGKGNHALMSGHGRSQGDVLLYPNGDRLGVVNVSLNHQLQPPSMNCYPDVALAKLEQQNRYIAHVSSEDIDHLRLEHRPVEATEGMEVRCLVANGNRGRVDSTAYIRHDEVLEIDWRLISVMNEQDGPVHEEGESGVLIVDAIPVQGRVRAVGMLVGIDELPLDDEEETIRRTSLAVPLTTNFEALQKDPHCNGGAITFLS